ncbi:MAG: N-acetylmuramoyl-L-alanine amidase [Cytophagales bacterium]|nr:N-acetylmuramoyl-L-alanine amidase [Cytophagales bacterium]
MYFLGVPSGGFIFLHAQSSPYKLEKVVLDAGHGGKDPGALGRLGPEKKIALRITLLLGQLIEKNLPDVRVIYTRKDDTYLTLHERADIANKARADLFISIHCNWSPRPHVCGSETYVMGLHRTQDNFEVAKRENAVILYEENSEEIYKGFDPTLPESYILFNLSQSAYLQNSLSLATKVENHFERLTKRKSLGVKMAGFWVLWETSMPSVLVEVGYLSHPREEKQLNTRRKQKQLAASIYYAFVEYKVDIESENEVSQGN